MLQFILERFALHDLSPKVWRWTGIIVALLTLIQGILSIGEVYHFRLAQGDSTGLAILIALSVFPVFGALFGLVALMLLALGRMAILAVCAIPSILSGIAGGVIIVSIGDQYSDLAGPYVLDCEKLPNKLYFIP